MVYSVPKGHGADLRSWDALERINKMKQHRGKHWVRTAVLGLILTALTAALAQAEWAFRGDMMPVPRLLKNVGDYVKAHPNDAEGYYTLGRINSAAFAQDARHLEAESSGNGLPRIPEYESHIPSPRDKA